MLGFRVSPPSTQLSLSALHFVQEPLTETVLGIFPPAPGAPASPSFMASQDAQGPARGTPLSQPHSPNMPAQPPPCSLRITSSPITSTLLPEQSCPLFPRPRFVTPHPAQIPTPPSFPDLALAWKHTRLELWIPKCSGSLQSSLTLFFRVMGPG